MLSNFFLSLALLFPNLTNDGFWLNKLKSTLHQPSGVQFLIDIEQKEFDKISTVTAQVKMRDTTEMLIIMDNETILISGDTIRTYNKATKQLIIDKIISEEFGLFTLIRGVMDPSYLVKSDIFKDKVLLRFNIDEYGYSGSIGVLKNGIPTTMSLSYAHNQVIDIDVKNFKVGVKKSDFLNLPKVHEIINLYE